MREFQIIPGFSNLTNPYYGLTRGIYFWGTQWVVYR